VTVTIPRLERRSFLQSLAALPGLGALGAASAGSALAKAAPRDVIRELGVRTIINAAGTYTSLTASLMPRPVFEAMDVASRKYVPLGDLHDAVGKRIAELTRCEAALVSAGAASALSIGTAACVAGQDRAKIQRLPETAGMKNEVIFQKSHRFGYDHAVRNVGVTIVEVETVQDLESAVNDKTAMMFFLNHEANAGKIGVEEFARLGKKNGVPTMIDAAADVPPVENLWRFTEMGYSLVAFSGGKGIRGPQSAGLLLGRQDLIEAGRMNSSPNSDTLCRTNKVNKEELVGMLVALEMFVNQDHKAVWKEWEDRCARIAAFINKIPGVKTEVKVPEIANQVPHLHITWDYQTSGIQPNEAAKAMREGSPSIEVRPGSEEELVIGVWMLEPGEDRIVGRRLKEVLERG
jgi:L-seryl-tRNA(Ser) seleniumtransferase